MAHVAGGVFLISEGRSSGGFRLSAVFHCETILPGIVQLNPGEQAQARKALPSSHSAICL
jgi:hypothetical protein